MELTGTVTEWLSRWLTLRHPVTYWSFWRDLLRLAPILFGVFAVLVVVVGTRISLVWFAPLPYVFVAATAGYAIRDLNFSGSLWSAVIGICYSFVLAVTNAGWLLLQRPTPILSAVAVLTFVALIAGFGAPSLHGRRDNQEFQAAYRAHKVDDDGD